MIIKGKVIDCTEHEKNGRKYWRVRIEPNKSVELDGFLNAPTPIGSPVIFSYRNGRVEDISII